MVNSMETLNDILATLDQLILNEESLLSLKDENHFMIEKDSLSKLQESLISHLFFLGDVYQQTKKRINRISDIEKTKKIYIKAKHYNRISNYAISNFADQFKPTQIRLRQNRLKKNLKKVLA